MVTLLEIKKHQDETSALIEMYEAQVRSKSIYPLTLEYPKLANGEKFVGFIVSADGTKKHAIILLDGEKQDVTWSKAKEWAKSIGGDLPDRVESALLFNTLKSEFSSTWYWTNEAYGSSHAWLQGFGNGNQHYDGVTSSFHARAVRRLEIQ